MSYEQPFSGSTEEFKSPEEKNLKQFEEQLDQGVMLVENLYQEALLNEPDSEAFKLQLRDVITQVEALGSGGAEAIKIFKPYFSLPPQEWADKREEIYSVYKKVRGNSSIDLKNFQYDLPSESFKTLKKKSPPEDLLISTDFERLSLLLHEDLNALEELIRIKPSLCIILPSSATGGSYVLKTALVELKKQLIAEGKVDQAEEIKIPYFIFLPASRFRDINGEGFYEDKLLWDRMEEGKGRAKIEEIEEIASNPPIEEYKAELLKKTEKNLNHLTEAEINTAVASFSQNFRSLGYEIKNFAKKLSNITSILPEESNAVFLDEEVSTGTTLRQAQVIAELAGLFQRGLNISSQIIKVSRQPAVLSKGLEEVEFGNGTATGMRLRRADNIAMHDLWLHDKMTLEKLKRLGELVAKVMLYKINGGKTF